MKTICLTLTAGILSLAMDYAESAQNLEASPGASPAEISCHSYKGTKSVNSRWLLDCIKRVETIKKGSTKKDVEKVLRFKAKATALLSTRNQIWESIDCPCIRVTLMFEREKTEEGKEASSWRVSCLSKPHLVFPEDASSLDSPKEAWLWQCMQKIRSIEPGAVREDLLNLFQPQGGLSSAGKGWFEYEECPYIKVEVEFDTECDVEGRAKSGKKDKIKCISIPYLESVFIMD